MSPPKDDFGKIPDAEKSNQKNNKKKSTAVIRLKNKFRKSGLGLIDSYFNAYFMYFVKKGDKKGRKLKENLRTVAKHPASWSLQTDDGAVYEKNIYDKYVNILTLLARIVGFFANIGISIKSFFHALVSTLISIDVAEESSARVKNFFVRLFSFILPAASIAITAALIIDLNSFTRNFEVFIDGKSIGFVRSVRDLSNTIEYIEKNMSSALGESYKFSGDASYKIVLAKNPSYLSNVELYNTLYNISQDTVVSAYGLYLDGNLVGAMLDETEINAVLGEILHESMQFAENADTDANIDADADIDEDADADESGGGTETETKVEMEAEPEPEPNSGRISGTLGSLADIMDIAEVLDVAETDEKVEFLNDIKIVETIYPKHAIVNTAGLKYAIEAITGRTAAGQAAKNSYNAVTESRESNAISRESVNTYANDTRFFSNPQIVGEGAYFYNYNADGFSAETDVELQFKTIRTEIAKVEVPFEIKYEESGEYYENVKMVQNIGVNGEKEVISKVTYVEGVEFEREILEINVIKAPVDQIVIVGSKEMPKPEATGTLIKPVKAKVITDRFVEGEHRGVDYGADFGTPVVASDGGTVIAAGFNSSYGNYVKVQHTEELITIYAHMSMLSVIYGQKVYQGQEVGKVGSTGYSTGNHLHFEIQINGRLVDPLEYVGE